jgi:hypothetical protein
MSVEPRPLLAFGPPIVGNRKPQRVIPPKPSGPGAGRQGQRLTPQFQELIAAFEAKRAKIGEGSPSEVDPSLVVVFDVVGRVQDFYKAVQRIDGLEFLAESVQDQLESDEDFCIFDSEGKETGKKLENSLYLVMSNIKAIDNLLKLFERWQSDPDASFEYGLAKFKDVFQHLKAIRRWGPEDRVRETGLFERWREELEVVGNYTSPVRVEVELWYRNDACKRSEAETAVKNIVIEVGGKIINSSHIADIKYHALLVEMPVQQVELALSRGLQSIKLLTTDDIMFVSPFEPMSIEHQNIEPVKSISLKPSNIIERKPRIALLDGMPFQNHDALQGRLLIDDPDNIDIGDRYPLESRKHGTAMASLIIHGDLSQPGTPLDRPLYVRPIMESQEGFREGEYQERVISTCLFPDLLHRAIKRIVEGENGHEAVAPSVRIVNLSLGAPARALTRRISPLGRLLDWLAATYNLLFIVSAGNHNTRLTIPVNNTDDIQSAKSAATRAVFDKSILRGILPPGDAINALTVGATHSDGCSVTNMPNTVWDITYSDGPAHYGSTGPGVRRSIKPDLYHSGGRAFYLRPVVTSGQSDVPLNFANTYATGPGMQVAAPNTRGSTDSTAFTFGTSDAAALVTREADRLFDILESGASQAEGYPIPDSQFHPLLVRALLIHASSWGEWYEYLKRDLGLSDGKARKDLTSLLGYGRLDLEKLGSAATNRAVLTAGEAISPGQRHTYEFPLPLSLRSKAEWHRFTITLAYAASPVSNLNKYRAANAYFTTPDTKLLAGDRIEADHHAVRRGSIQHEIVDGVRAMSFAEGEVFPVHVECAGDNRRRSSSETIRYALIVSAETAEQTSNTIYDEVKNQLRIRRQERSRIQQ